MMLMMKVGVSHMQDNFLLIDVPAAPPQYF